MTFPRMVHKKSLIDLTSLIDVMFLLLLYFVLTMSTEPSSSIPINLSTMSGKKDANEPNFYPITITATNLVFASDKLIEIEKVGEHLLSLKKKYEYILLRGDSKSDLGTILKVWDACKKSGFENIKMAVNKEN